MRIIFIGPPGAGKGTQSVKLAEHLKIPHLSTGEILRSAKKAQTEIGKLVAPVMDAGGLVSDDLIFGVVKERLEQQNSTTGYLLDGFPRTIRQASDLNDYLTKNDQSLDHVIELRVADEIVQKRLVDRFQNLENPREDDRPEAIPRRLRVYHSQTQPILKFYSSKDFPNLLKVVDGVGTMDEVFQRILTQIAS